jgi:hypothetical protein
MSKRAFLAGILGGVAMFVWASIAHMALPLGRAGWSEVPAEQPLLTALQSTLGPNGGQYIYPALGTAPDAMQQYDKKLAVSPSGILIYHPPGAKSLTPAQLITEFLSELVESLLAVYLLAQTALKTPGRRAGFVAVAGVLAAVVTNISYWNWYGFTGAYTAASMTTQIVGFIAAGAVIALVMKNRALRALPAR